MPGRSETRRINLFHKYSKNLELWRPEYKGHYACPLCLMLFDEAGVRGVDPALTAEDVIPKGLGRKRFVLTCKRCNNTAGHEIDDHLHTQLKLEGLFQGQHQAPLKAKIQFGNDSLHASVANSSVNQLGLQITIPSKSSDNRAVTRLKESFAHPIQFHMTFDAPDQNRSRIAVLKAGYLMAFRYFGYGYVLSPVMEPIRETIRSPHQPRVPIESIILEGRGNDIYQKIGWINSPKELAAIAVPVHFDRYQKGRIVVLPIGDKTYEQWSQNRCVHADKTPFQVTLDYFPDDESFLNGSSFMGFCRPQGTSVVPMRPGAFAL